MKIKSEAKCGSVNLAKRVRAILVGAALVFCLTTANHAAAQAGPATVFLGSAGTYAVLGSSTVTSTGPTTVNGDLGVWAGTAYVPGTPAAIVNGSIHAGDVIAQHAQASAAIAYHDAKGRTTAPTLLAGDLSGKTLAPGLYKSTSSLEILGTLTLHGSGVYIFQVASALTVGNGGTVVLSGGATADNVFWQVGSSATLGTTADFKGTIMALASVTLATGARLDGRALALTAAVTLDSNNVTIPIGSNTVIVVLPPPPPPRNRD
jgi:Ice-binding-like